MATAKVSSFSPRAQSVRQITSCTGIASPIPTLKQAQEKTQGLGLKGAVEETSASENCFGASEQCSKLKNLAPWLSPSEGLQERDDFETGKSRSTQPEWMDLKALQGYACVSERTLRDWIHRPENLLPAVRVGTKILVRRSGFDEWLENHRLERIDVACIVNQVLGGVRATN